MTRTEFVYVTYIATTPQRVWDALLKPEFARQYWGHENHSEWKVGAKWEHREAGSSDAKITGKIVEFDPPRHLVMTWALPSEAAHPDAHSRVTIDLEPIEDMVRLSVTHDRLVPGSDMQQKIENGWPRVFSSLKSFIETGKPLPVWAKARS
jgi:uncharacterized protein YndB with AHSA1/START domain